MKQIVSLFVFLISLFILAGYAIGQEYDPILAEGTTFIYQVEYFGEEYLFISTILSISEDELRFKYFFSNSGNQGDVSMSKEALADATKLFNYFSGDDYTLTDQTSGFISSSVAEKIKKEEAVMLDTGDGAQEFKLWHDPELWSDLDDGEYEYPITLDDRFEYRESLHAWVLKDAEDHAIGFHSIGDYHLILEMDLGWKIWLVSIL